MLFVELHIKAANCEGRGVPSVQFDSPGKYMIRYTRTQLTERVVTYINVKCHISEAKSKSLAKFDNTLP